MCLDFLRVVLQKMILYIVIKSGHSIVVLVLYYHSFVKITIKKHYKNLTPVLQKNVVFCNAYYYIITMLAKKNNKKRARFDPGSW